MSFHATQLHLSHTVPLQQSAAFAAALTHLGRPPLRLAFPGGRGEAQVMRRAFGPVRLGVVSRCDLSRADLRHVAGEAGCAALVLNAESAQGAHGFCLRTPSHVAELDLRPDEAALRAGLQQKWRNRLNFAERQGLYITEGVWTAETGQWLLAMDQTQGARKGYTNWPPELTKAYARANRGQVRMIQARQKGKVISAMVFLSHGSIASYHIGWSDAAGYASGAHNALIWEAVTRFKSRGIERIDLGSVETDRAPGLARFKLGTGAALRPLGGTWLVLPGFMRGA